MNSKINLARKTTTSPSPLVVGAVVGLIGGSLIGFGESVKALLTVLNSVLPASPESMDVLALVAGLLFLSALYAIGSGVAFTLLGGLLAAWQSVRSVSIPSHRVAALLSTALVGLYTLFLDLDRLGIQELRSASAAAAMPMSLLPLGQAAVVGMAAWFMFDIVTERWQQGQGGWLRPLRWATARNLAGGLFIVLLVVPLAFVGLRRFNPSQRFGEGVVHAATSTASAQQPNIIYITIDALRADHLGAYGYEKANTPNIDSFAAESIVFEQANSQAPWTFPSFASQFTSMYPTDLNLSVDNTHISAMYGRYVADSHVTMAEAIQKAGYRTQAIVTNPWLRPEFGFAQGFDGFMQVDDARIFHFSKLADMSLLTTARQMPPLYQAIRAVYTMITGNPGEPLVWDVRADRVTAEATAWLRQNREAPFFLWIHYVDPHYPFDPPAGYRPAVDNLTAERLTYLSSYNEEDVYTGRARLRPEDKAAIIELYDGEIAYTDVYFGQLLDTFDALGLRENSVVILSADHGDEFWEHGGYQHGHSLYDELIRIPLIVRGPGVLSQPGRRITADVQHVDLLPTLAEIAGANVPPEARGRSWLPLVSDDAAVHDTTYNFAEALFLDEEQKAVRGEGYKLIYAPFSDRYELYDLVRDPGEQQNIADVRPDQVEKLDALLEEWMSATGAPDGAGPGSNSAAGVDPSTIYELLENER